jgi:hypothetical protein
MKEYTLNFNRGDKRSATPQSKDLQSKRYALVRKLKVEKDESVRKQLIDKIRIIEKEKFSVPHGDEMDPDFKKLKYVRYADDFLVGVIGSRKECEEIKKEIKKFLSEKLKLELSDEKTLVTHSETPARFLNYEIEVRKNNLTKRDRGTGRLSRIYNKRVVLKMPADVMKKKLIEYGAIRFKHHNGEEQWRPFSRAHLLNKDDLELLSQYNSEIIGFYNYYSIAVNVGAMNSFKYIMEYSLYKTFGRKYQMSVGQVCKKYKVDGEFTIFYTNKKGGQKRRIFYNEGFGQKKETISYSVDHHPDLRYTMGRTSLIDRLSAKQCELCGAWGEDLQMHHLRKMSDIKEGKEPWQIRMIARRRKTMAVCTPCHRKIHSGNG